jgi:hypothetical protein
MTIDYAGYFQQRIADIGGDGRYAFDLPRALSFVLEGGSRFVAGAVGGVVSG